jgi:hypothetical protein
MRRQRGPDRSLFATSLRTFPISDAMKPGEHASWIANTTGGANCETG